MNTMTLQVNGGKLANLERSIVCSEIDTGNVLQPNRKTPEKIK